MSHRSCSFCGKTFTRSFNLRRHIPNCKMNSKYYDTDLESENSRSSEEASISSEESEVMSSEIETDDECIENEEDLWSELQDESIARHSDELQELVDRFLEKGDLQSVAEAKAHNRMLPVYRKELRHVLMERLEQMHEMRRDPFYKKIVKTREDLMNNDDYDWYEATEAAIHARKFLLNKLFHEQELPQENNEVEQ